MFGNIVKVTGIVATTLALISCDSGAFLAPTDDGPNEINGFEVASLELDELSLIIEDDTVTVHATALDVNGDPIEDPALELEWTSTDENVATIQSTGGTDGELITGSPGTTTLTASYDQVSASTTIEVHNRPIDLLYVAGSGQQGAPGTTLPDSLAVRAVDKRGDAVDGVYITFSVTAGGGAVSRSGGTTDSTGTLRSAWTLGSSGVQEVRAVASEDQPRVKKMHNWEVLFTAAVADTAADVSSVTVTPDSAVVDTGGTVDLDVDVRDGRGNAVTSGQVSWVSSDTAVAHVDPQGVVAALAEGQAVISATTHGVTGTSDVTVASSSEGTLTISASGNTLYGIGDTLALSVEARTADGTLIVNPDVQWSSSDPDIAMVDSMGTVISRALGTAVIAASTVCCAGDFYDVAVVAGTPETVTDLQVVAVGPDSVSLRWTEVDDGTGQPASYALRYGAPSLDWGSAVDTEATVEGTGIGTTATFTFRNLSSSSDYEFALVSYRGTPNEDAVYGSVSNAAAATTSITSSETALTISPEMSRLADVGDTVQLSAAARDSTGTSIEDPIIDWVSLDAATVTVDSMGTVTAQALGTALIVATAPCCGADTATVQVGASSIIHTNEPAGYTALTERDFDAEDEDGWDDYGGPSDLWNIVTDATAPVSPPNIGRVTYYEGYESGTGPINNGYGSFNAPNLYIHHWIRLSDNYYNQSTGTKVHYYMDSSHGGSSPIYTMVRGGGSDPMWFEVRRQGDEFATSSNFSAGRSDNEVSPPADADAIVRGEWVEVEILMEGNTPGVEDGSLHVWINGTKIMQFTDMVGYFNTGANGYFDSMKLSPIYGGNPNPPDVVPADQFMEFDYFYASTGG